MHFNVVAVCVSGAMCVCIVERAVVELISVVRSVHVISIVTAAIPCTLAATEPTMIFSL